MQVLEGLLSNRPRETSSLQLNHTSLLQERLIGASNWSSQARAQIAAHAAHDNTIILEGEPGTGKEFLGRLIHRCSARSKGPFVALSFDSVSDESAHAALFGSVRSLPTGARHIHRGLVEAAEGGVVFIADASKLSLSLRASISRFIQHDEFRRLGDLSVHRADVRVILGSTGRLDKGSRNEWSLVRTDIRIGDMLFIPPLRERPDDIEPLIRHFVKLTCEQSGREVREVSPEALAVMHDYSWPGNVGELKSVVDETMRRCGPPTIGLSHLPTHMVFAPQLDHCVLPQSGFDLAGEVRRYEKSILCAALRQCHGVQNKAAGLLGVKPTTLNMKLKVYGIAAEAYK